MTEKLNPAYSILMVDDEESWLHRLAFTLEYEAGLNNVIRCSDSRRVLEILQEQTVSLVLLDLTMPYVGGQELLEQLVVEHPQVPVIILSGLNQISTAVECVKTGAFDYFIKTEKQQRLLNGINRALAFSELQQQNLQLKGCLLYGKLKQPEAFSEIISCDSRMQAIFSYLEAIASSPEPILITGESGVGKELIARSIHQVHDSQSPFVALNAAGLDDNTFSDTLFGHVSGAFTGASRARLGLIEKAAGGILFLDEIGDLSFLSQVKLLRFLQEGEYYPLGSDTARRVDLRIVFATNHDLEQKQLDGSFRRDLYYRLCSHHVHLPPLRERRKDLPLLLDYYVGEAARQLGKKKPVYPRELEKLLAVHDFPGNIRELRGIIFDALSTHRGGTLSLDHFRQVLGSKRTASAAADAGCQAEPESPFSSLDPFPTLTESTEMIVAEALRRADNNQGIAAGMLGITRQALNKRINSKK